MARMMVMVLATMRVPKGSDGEIVRCCRTAGAFKDIRYQEGEAGKAK